MTTANPMILLTGGSGVLGNALLNRLADRPIIALTHHKPIADTPTHTCVRGDITAPWLGLHPDTYRDLARRVDVIVHTAGSVNFALAAKHLHTANVRGTGHILRFAEDANAHLVYVSTAFIARADTFADIVTPNGVPTMAAYVRSKTTAEATVRESGLPATIARVSALVGDSTTGRLARIQAFHHMIGMGIHGMIPFLPGTPESRIDLIPQDVAAAALTGLADTRPDGTHWITAGPAALPLPRLIDLVYEVGANQANLPPHAVGVHPPQWGMHAVGVHPPLFKTIIADLDTCQQMIDMTLAHARPGAPPNTLQRLIGLMATYTGNPLPTSIPDLTPAMVERALTATCLYLATLPLSTWQH